MPTPTPSPQTIGFWSHAKVWLPLIGIFGSAILSLLILFLRNQMYPSLYPIRIVPKEKHARVETWDTEKMTLVRIIVETNKRTDGPIDITAYIDNTKVSGKISPLFGDYHEPSKGADRLELPFAFPPGNYKRKILVICAEARLRSHWRAIKVKVPIDS